MFLCFYLHLRKAAEGQWLLYHVLSLSSSPRERLSTNTGELKADPFLHTQGWQLIPLKANRISEKGGRDA